jgi:hypothetical protein
MRSTDNLDEPFANPPSRLSESHTQLCVMTHLLQTSAPLRAPRTCFAETTPAVVRLRDGRCITAKVQVLSLTGGLLCLSKPLDPGSLVKLMFLTSSGSVLGAAEMLSPVSWNVQPFKFLRLYDADRRRLQAAIKLSLDHNRLDQGLMEKYRAW